ncbi:MAG: ABC transporter permease [Christensenellales bacterium]|jgi:ABC-type antimicrobial peptide transport system permease subunit
MKWIDILSAALNSLMRRKLRSALTILGVVIGTAAIVVTISLGYGAEQTQMQALESFTNLRLITVYPYFGGYGTSETTSGARITKITDGVLNQVRKIKGVSAVTPIVSFYTNLNISTGKQETNTYCIAVLPRDFAKMQELKSGTNFSSNTDRMEFIMSEMQMCDFHKTGDEDYEYVDTWSYLYQGKELPLPKINWLQSRYTGTFTYEDYSNVDETTQEPEIVTREYDAKMVGIIAADLNDSQYSYAAIVNLGWLKKAYKKDRQFFEDLGLTGLSNYDNVQVLAKDVDSVETVVKELKDMGLSCYSPMEYVATIKEQIATMQSFLGFIGAISMLVAALSIANTMMMSIYERTREIGVMKVLGCSLSNIGAMFLSEAFLIGIVGGALGLGVSYALSYALNNVEALQQAVGSIMSSTALFSGESGSTSVIPTTLSVGTWAFVTVIAVISGIYPAQRAMRLSSLAAIRTAD